MNERGNSPYERQARAAPEGELSRWAETRDLDLDLDLDHPPTRHRHRDLWEA